MFSRSRILWFLSILVLTTPLLLATFRGDGDLTPQVWSSSLGIAAAIGVGIAWIFGKGRAT